MAIKLRETKKIRGIEIKLKSTTGNLNICQLADDTTLFLKSKHEITIAMNIIGEFGNYAGLKLSKNKTGISDLNTVILPINEVYLWFQFFLLWLYIY
jgi:hypothetical protein